MHKGEVNVISLNYETSFIIKLLTGSKHFTVDQILTEEKEIPAEIPVLISDIDEIRTERKEVSGQKKESGIILVVEDHFDLRNFICEQLEDDYSVIEAGDGEKGLSLAEELLPDLVISDIMMPKMDGYQLCKRIKSNFKTNHIPVILLTARAALENKLEGLETGADDYLVKPFNTDELKTRVRNLILVRQQMREKYQSQMVLKPGNIIVPSTQKIFIDRLTSIIENNISNDGFSVEKLCGEIGMSRAQLHRKIKAITNQSTSEFIRNFRLQRAAILLEQNFGNIAEISYEVGFSSQAYFTKMFQDLYKQTPLEYKKQHSK
jgi:DNA-binding response OmpR family regulator